MSFYKVGQEFETQQGKTIIVTKIVDNGTDMIYHMTLLDDLLGYYANVSGFTIDEIELCTKVVNGEWEPIESKSIKWRTDGANARTSPDNAKTCTCDGHTLLWYGCKCK